MAYHTDPYDNSIVLDGFEKGIADNPYAGISDMRNCNIISVPGEASVLFSTSKISPTNWNGTMTTSSAGGDTVTLDVGTIESGQAIQFSVLSDVTKGIALDTTYWAVGSSGTYQLYDNYARTSLVNITADGLTGTWATVNMGTPKYFATDGTYYWMIDSNGRVWSNLNTTSGTAGIFWWTYTGNKPNNNSSGQGIVYYQASDGTGYIFAFSGQSIDYTPSTLANVAWSYQWSPSAGTVGSWNANPTVVLKNTLNNHEALTAPDNSVYFCDGNYIGSFFPTDPTVAFVPTTKATYTFDESPILPCIDIAQCLTFLGTNLMIGGKRDVIYPWDTTSPTFSYPILLAERNIQKMITVNTNTYALVGNRGRIYKTNGSQAELYKKIPDHISGTIEPYFTWGGLASHKNQIYFGFSVTTNLGGTNNNYGGVWAIDVDTEALRLTNQLSYGTYAGYASAIIANTTGNPNGTGLFIGWDNGASGYGIDTTVSNLYTNSQATIDFDLIPIGTFDKAKNFTRVEYKLNKPMVSGESVTIQYRKDFSQTYTTILSDNTVGNYSSSGPVNFSNAQWIQLRVILNGTNSSPSYTRLKEIRILN